MKIKRVPTILIMVLVLALVIVLSMLPAPADKYAVMAQPALIAVAACAVFIHTSASLLIAVLVPAALYFLFWNAPFVPQYLTMLLCLTVTGAVTGLCFRYFKVPFPAVLLGLLSGRIVTGIVETVYCYVNDLPYTLEDYLHEAFLDCWPGLAAALVLIPLIHYLVFRKKDDRVK